MTFEEFKNVILSHLPTKPLCNPGGGTSKIKNFTDEEIVYIRGKTQIHLKIRKLYDAYEHFQGTFVTTKVLKEFDRSFDSNASGHNCNCTFGFMLLVEAGLADTIVKKERCFGAHFLKETSLNQ